VPIATLENLLPAGQGTERETKRKGSYGQQKRETGYAGGMRDSAKLRSMALWKKKFREYAPNYGATTWKNFIKGKKQGSMGQDIGGGKI